MLYQVRVMSCHHISLKKGKLSQKKYLRVLMDVVRPWMETVASGRPYVFQQDSSYESFDSKLALRQHRYVLVQGILASQDLNPLDYYVWSVVERITNKSRHLNVMSLRTTIEAAFVDMDSATIQRACERFRLRLE